MTPAEIVSLLDMQPHPEGGWYAETWRERPAGSVPRAAGS
ncbi:MAG: cupin domain-containing protein, partial [Myxococcota bacterium]